MVIFTGHGNHKPAGHSILWVAHSEHTHSQPHVLSLVLHNTPTCPGPVGGGRGSKGEVKGRKMAAWKTRQLEGEGDSDEEQQTQKK